MFLPHEAKIDTNLLAFPKFNKEVSILFRIRRKIIAGVILPLGETDCLDWSSDKDDRLHLD